jgi:formamidopyrimidine-DNA glycosylase
MPELPDVEIFRRYLESTALHKNIKAVEAETDILRNTTRPDLNGLKGVAFTGTSRHGKHLFVNLDDSQILVFHFGMTGYFSYYENEDKRPNHVKAEFHFNDGHLAYINIRKLGFVQLIKDKKRYIQAQDLGIDPLEDKLDKETFLSLLKNKQGTLKGALMDQSMIAGLGNVYSDEICFQVGIHPGMNVKKLSDENLDKLYDKMFSMINQAIDAKAHPDNMPKTFLTANRQEDRSCPVCDGKIVKKKISGRSAYFCDKHQK